MTLQDTYSDLVAEEMRLLDTSDLFEQALDLIGDHNMQSLTKLECILTELQYRFQQQNANSYSNSIALTVIESIAAPLHIEVNHPLAIPAEFK